MASAREKFTKDGKRYYEIRHRVGRNKPELSTRWYVPEGWSKKTIERELAKQVAEFERKVKSGEVVTLKEKKAIEEQQEAERKAEEARIQTFKQYTEKVYLPSLEVTAAKHTISNFKGNLKNHIYPQIGSLKIQEIGYSEINALLLAAQKKLGVGSVSKLYTILKLVFKAAKKEKVIAFNPMDDIEKPKPKKEEEINEEPESYTLEETLNIIDCLSNEPLQWQCYIRLLIDTGCRRSEACGLQWGDIDFQNDTVSFVRQIAYTPEDGIYIDTLKNHKKRKVYVDHEVMELLKQFKDEKMPTKKKVVSISSEKEDKEKDKKYIFTHFHVFNGKTYYRDEPLHPDSPTKYFTKFGKKYGIDHFHPHKCRHTQASISITNGADILSVSKKLGHSKPDITLRVYAHASEESQKQVSSIFQNALRKADEQRKKQEKEG